MDEKVFDLMEKMYCELQEVRKDQKEMKNDIKQLGAKIDGEVLTKIEALFDGYKQNTEAIRELKDKVDALACKVDKQEVEIRVIKGAK